MAGADLVEVEKLRQLERLLEGVIPKSDDPVIIQLLGFGAAIAFLSFILKTTYKCIKAGKVDFKEHINDIIILFITVLLFCTPIYCGFVALLNDLNAILEEVFSANFHRLMFQMAYMYSQISENIKDGVSIFNPSIFKAPADILLASVAYYTMVIPAYIVRSIPDYFYAIVIISGPIIAALTPLSMSFFQKWISLLFASLFCVLFFDLLLVVLTITDAFLLISEVMKDHMVIGIIVIGITLSSFIGIGIDIVGHIFGVKGIFGLVRILTPYGLLQTIIGLVFWVKNPNPNKLLQGLKGKPRKV